MFFFDILGWKKLIFLKGGIYCLIYLKNSFVFIDINIFFCLCIKKNVRIDNLNDFLFFFKIFRLLGN